MDNIPGFHEEGFPLGKIGYACPGYGLTILRGIPADNSPKEHVLELSNFEYNLVIPPHESIHEQTIMGNTNIIVGSILDNNYLTTYPTLRGWGPYVEAIQDIIEEESTQVQEVNKLYEEKVVESIFKQGIEASNDETVEIDSNAQARIKESIRTIADRTNLEDLLNDQGNPLWNSKLQEWERQGRKKEAVCNLIDLKLGATIGNDRIIEISNRLLDERDIPADSPLLSHQEVTNHIEYQLNDLENKSKSKQVFDPDRDGHKRLANSHQSSIQAAEFLKRSIPELDNSGVEKFILPLFNILFPIHHLTSRAPHLLVKPYSVSIFPQLVCSPDNSFKLVASPFSYVMQHDEFYREEFLSEHCQLYRDLESWWHIKELEVQGLPTKSVSIQDYAHLMCQKIDDFYNNFRDLQKMDSTDLRCDHCKYFSESRIIEMDESKNKQSPDTDSFENLMDEDHNLSYWLTRKLDKTNI